MVAAAAQVAGVADPAAWVAANAAQLVARLQPALLRDAPATTGFGALEPRWKAANLALGVQLAWVLHNASEVRPPRDGLAEPGPLHCARG